VEGARDMGVRVVSSEDVVVGGPRRAERSETRVEKDIVLVFWS